MRVYQTINGQILECKPKSLCMDQTWRQRHCKTAAIFLHHAKVKSERQLRHSCLGVPQLLPCE